MKKLSLLLTAAVTLAASLQLQADDHECDTIVGIALGNPDFSTLVQAVVKSDLVATLDGNRDFTVFAPDNAAFDAAAFAVLGYLDEEETIPATGPDLVNALDVDTLTDILLYHVAPGVRLSGDVLGAHRIRTMNKSFLFVEGTTLEGGNSSADINTAAIDLEACNGVIHAIEFVLLP